MSMTKSLNTFVESLPQSVLSQTIRQRLQTFVELFPNAPHVLSLSKSFISTTPIFATDVGKGIADGFIDIATLDLNTVHSETEADI